MNDILEHGGGGNTIALARYACRAMYDGDRTEAAKCAVTLQENRGIGSSASAEIDRFVDRLIRHLDASNALFPDPHLAEVLADLLGNDPRRG